MNVGRSCLHMNYALDMNVTDMNALMNAAHAGDAAAVRRLLEADVTTSTQDSHGSTALMFACAAGHSAVVQDLCTSPHGAEDVNLADATGRTPLMAAAQSGHLNAMRALHSAGASLTAIDQFGMTCLHVACRAGQLEACNELLCVGARASLADFDGLLPIDHCDPYADNYPGLRQALLAAATLEEALAAHGPGSSDTHGLGAAGASEYLAGQNVIGTGDVVDDGYGSDQFSFKSYDSQQDDRPWH